MNLYILKYLFFLLLIPSILISQEKYDNIWLLNSQKTRKIMVLEWGKNTLPDTSTLQIRSKITVGDPNASICDKNGKLMYYSNGCAIAGSDYQIVPNGTQINPGWVHQHWCYDDSTDPYPASDNIVFLPSPADTNKYYLFHTARSDLDLVVLPIPFNRFLYTEIDVSKGKTGLVVKKNVLLKEDTLSELGVKACKHANGIDWWVIAPTKLTHSYNRALLTKDSVRYMGKQKIAETYPYDSFRNWSGQSVFSPNGKKYVRTDPHNGTFIFDFDRCTGLLSNPIYIDTLRPRYYYSGVGISPNSRFLYLTNIDVLYQYDLEADNIVESRIEIAIPDSFLNEYGDPMNFYKCQLAPDNKIYIGSAGTMNWLNIIHKPNEKGLACDFRQHDLKLPRFYFEGLPNMPHYRMPKLEGIDCSKKEGSNEATFLLYPNPTEGQLHLKTLGISTPNFTWELYDALGHLVLSQRITNIVEDFELPTFLTQGIYFWRVLDSVKQLQSGKLVLIE
jgi:hypothetical protein